MKIFRFGFVIFFLSVFLLPYTTSAATTFLLHGEPSELSSLSNGGIITPATGPTGTLMVNGGGSVNFTPVTIGNGMYFLNCCSNTNNAYYKFTGATVGNIFSTQNGSITFYLKSRQNWAQRKLGPIYSGSSRQSFEVEDTPGHALFSFVTVNAGSYMYFNYTVGSTASDNYYVSNGQEDILFGNGVTLKVTLTWDGTKRYLYLNDVLKQTTSYTPATANWSSSSLFLVGGFDSYPYGVYNSSDDVIDEFQVTGTGGATDTTPPIISSISSGGISTSAATISWNTDEGSDSQVEYGLTTGYGQSSTINSSLVTSHSVSLSSLSASTLYHYRVKSKDASGNLTTSSDNTFTTSAPAPDTIPPTIPTSLSATVISSSQINLSWSPSTDVVGVTGYKIYRAGTQIGTSPNTSYSDSGLSASTAYTYTVSAYDAAGNNSGQSSSVSTTTQAVSSGGGNITWSTLFNSNGVTAPYANQWHVSRYDPVSRTTLFYVMDNANSEIFSNSIWSWNSTTHTFTKIGTSGSTGSHACAPDTLTWPGDRHPMGQFVIDTKRNRLWLWGGVCNGFEPQDLYYMSLNTNPTTDTFTKLPTPVPTTSGRAGSAVYDADDDVIFQYGYDNGPGTHNNWIYCPVDSGSLTSKQTAAGCTTANGWTELAVIGGGPMNGQFFPGMVYDPINKKVVVFGGANAGLTAGSNETWTYDIPSKTWTKLTPTLSPPPSYCCGSVPPLIYNSNDNKIYYLDNANAPGATSLWSFTLASNTWTKIATATGPIRPITMEYDPSTNKLIVYSSDPDGYSAVVNEGLFSGTPPPPDTTAPSAPTNFAITNVSTNTISLSWTGSTDDTAVAGYKIFRNNIQVGTSTLALYTDTGLTANTTYSYKVSAYDSSNNVSVQSSSVSTTTTQSLPIISSFTATPSSITSGGSSTLSWNTSGATLISITPGNFSSTNSTGSLVVNPTITTQYILSAGNSAGTTTSTVSVNVSLNPDTTPPTVNLTAQDSGGSPITASSTVFGNITLTYSASDPVVGGQTTSGIASLSLTLDGVIVASSTNSSLVYPLNTRTLLNTTHILVLTAKDTVGNTSSPKIFQLKEIGFLAVP